MPTPVKGATEPPTLFAVVCKWADLRGPVVKDRGHIALIVEAADANEAQNLAYTARPDLWERDGYTRSTAVHPATSVSELEASR